MRWTIKSKRIGRFCYRLAGYQHILGSTDNITPNKMIGRIACFFSYQITEIIRGNTKTISTKAYRGKSLGMWFACSLIII